MKKKNIKKCFRLDSFASEVSHVCHRNKKRSFNSNKILLRAKRATFARGPKNKRCFKLDSFASEASHVYRKVRPLASEASPSARSAQPPAGLARRSGAAGAETGLRVPKYLGWKDTRAKSAQYYALAKCILSDTNNQHEKKNIAKPLLFDFFSFLNSNFW